MSQIKECNIDFYLKQIFKLQFKKNTDNYLLLRYFSKINNNLNFYKDNNIMYLYYYYCIKLIIYPFFNKKISKISKLLSIKHLNKKLLFKMILPLKDKFYLQEINVNYNILNNENNLLKIKNIMGEKYYKSLFYDSFYELKNIYVPGGIL